MGALFDLTREIERRGEDLVWVGVTNVNLVVEST